MNISEDFKMIVDGKLAARALEFDVFNPVTGEAFSQTLECCKTQLEEALASLGLVWSKDTDEAVAIVR